MSHAIDPGMETRSPFWERVRHPRGPLGRAARRAAMSAPGVYAAYLAHGLGRPRALVLRSRRNLISGREVEPGAEGGEPFVDCSWVFALAETAPGRRRFACLDRLQA